MLDTSLNALFGIEEPEHSVMPQPGDTPTIPVEDAVVPVTSKTFPGTKDGLTLAAAWGNVACYASRAPKKVAGPLVYFDDESFADMANAAVTNNGAQEIRLVYSDDEDVYEDISGDEHCWSASGIHSLDIRLGSNADCTIEKGTDGKCTVDASGSEAFMKNLDVQFIRGTLHVTSKPVQDPRHLFGMMRGRGREDNSITIRTGFGQGKNCRLNISGSGSISCEPDFVNSDVSIAGSGDMELQGAGELKASIAGSGDISFHSARDAELSIAGSGDVSGKWVAGGLECSVAGSGDIEIGEAAVESLTVNVAGSGDVSIERLEANDTTVYIMGSGEVSLGQGTGGDLDVQLSGSGVFCGEHCTFGDARIRLDGSSEAAIGCVTGRSEERVAKSAHLRILRRGEQA